MDNKKLLKQYAETGAVLTDYQLSRLGDNLLITYFRRRAHAIQHEVYGADVPCLEDYEYKHIPLKYADTFYKPFITQRVVKFNHYLYPEEFEALPEHLVAFYLELRIKHIKTNGYLDSREIKAMPEEMKHRYYTIATDIVIDTNGFFHSAELEIMPDDLRTNYLKQRILNGLRLWDYEIEYINANPELQELYNGRNNITGVPF
jgi:hypothetical protein